MELILVITGSALGGLARFWLSGIVGRRVGETFPWGTLAVNASGALVIGVVAALAAGPGVLVGARFWHFAVYGFLGSYTTVSSFSLQTLALLQDGERWHAAANVLLSLGCCLSAAGLGFFAMTALMGPP
jgi:fluoride exporter